MALHSTPGPAEPQSIGKQPGRRPAQPASGLKDLGNTEKLEGLGSRAHGWGLTGSLWGTGSSPSCPQGPAGPARGQECWLELTCRLQIQDGPPWLARRPEERSVGWAWLAQERRAFRGRKQWLGLAGWSGAQEGPEGLTGLFRA